MKCTDVEKIFDLVFDGEADDLQKTRMEKHLANCVSCRSNFENRQTVQNLFKNQPGILPDSAFDARMMQEFVVYQKRKRQAQSSWLMTFVQSLSFSMRFAAWCGILIFGLGTAFLLGRMSVASSAQIALSKPEIYSNAADQTPKEIVKFVEDKPKIITKTEYATKYIQVPVIKEKVVTKFIARGESQKLKTVLGKEDLSEANLKNLNDQKDIAEQFNLKDLQPISNISYKIIKKGDTNE